MNEQEPKQGNIVRKSFETISGSYLVREGCGSNPKKCGYSKVTTTSLGVPILTECNLPNPNGDIPTAIQCGQA